MSAKKMYIGLFIGLAAVCSFLPFLNDILHRVGTSSISSNSKDALPANCSNGEPIHAGLATSDNPILQKLAEYEAVCHGAVADSVMLFVAMPTSLDDATSGATDAATNLKAFAALGITPLVVFEPITTSHTVLSDIRNGMYDSPLNRFYATLQTLGITDKQMGTWVLFPEANTPEWYTTQPSDFVANVSKVGSLQKQFFPLSKVSILLDSHTYPDNDTSWSKGKLTSLSPYVATLPKNLIDSFGMQGFPTISPANVTPATRQLQVSDFLPIYLASDAANILGIHDVWLNTGTFKAMYTNDPAAKVELTSTQRQQILQDVAKAAQQVEAQHFNVTVNLFAQDKSQNVDERVDWSYWRTGQAKESADTMVFDTFVRELRRDDVKVSLYDTGS